MRVDFAGIAVALLALGLGAGFLAAILGITTPVEGGAQLLNLLAGGMVAIVAGYVARYGGPSRAVTGRHRANEEQTDG